METVTLPRFLSQHLYDILVDLHLVTPPLEDSVFYLNRLKYCRIICCIMRIPKLRRVFVAGEFVWDGINALVAVGHNTSAPLVSCHERK